MTNIKCKKDNKEIDLLAINPETLERYHVESRIATTFKLKDKATYTKDGRCHKNGLDYFHKEKFNNPIVQEKIKEFFGENSYHKWLVVWDWNKEGSNEFAFKELAEKQYGIEVVTLRAMIFRFMKCRITSGSRDDILRTMELVRLMEERKVKIQKKLNKQRLEKDTK
jgi:hypothetical protein